MGMCWGPGRDADGQTPLWALGVVGDLGSESGTTQPTDGEAPTVCRKGDGGRAASQRISDSGGLLVKTITNKVPGGGG